MTEAIILHSPRNKHGFAESEADKIVEMLPAEASKLGVNLRFHPIRTPALVHGYKEAFRSHKNVATFGYKASFSWMNAAAQNIMFFERSVLGQTKGYFCDAGGLFSDSNLSTRAKMPRPVNEYDVERLAFDWFGWKAGSGGNPNGPVLVCLQMKTDRSVGLEYFPLRGDSSDTRECLLRLVAASLDPSVPVVFRPHPKDSKDLRPKTWMPHWVIDTQKAPFKEILPNYRAVITISSTCASEAAFLGLPVATFGLGPFTGHDITLDCSTNPGKLKSLLDWKPDLEACYRYIRTILTHHFLSFSDPYAFPCTELYDWLRRCK